MATITITRGLFYNEEDISSTLISAFEPQTIEFKFNRGSEINTYAKIDIGGILFSATKKTENYEINTDLYLFDMSGILPYLLGFPPEYKTNVGLRYTLNFNVKGYSSAGVELANTSHGQCYLCFGYANIGKDRLSINNGSTLPIYHNGTISFYWDSVGGTYACVINGISYNYVLVNGYNTITLNSTHLINGLFVIGGGLGTFYLFYKSITNEKINWIDRDGKWQEWNFRLIVKNYEVQKTNEIPLFAINNKSAFAKSILSNTLKKNTFEFDTIAFDENHYAQLVEISESPRVLYDGRIFNVKDASKSTSLCKQNLKFKLTLEIEENAATY